ncbi:hypothetical protein BD410DRAFT_845202 [Rickenella mellea]|uniref:Uncharacterized protein n=1 Tax=Rickenella mellea TaxID=50990 RepID=A0A4Y7PIV3_9AGAM|nr:hypothetical protein BD410DRAFT_845202 [Rickenella mellea]
MPGVGLLLGDAKQDYDKRGSRARSIVTDMSLMECVIHGNEAQAYLVDKGPAVFIHRTTSDSERAFMSSNGALQRRGAIRGGAPKSKQNSQSDQTTQITPNATGKDAVASESTRPATTPTSPPEHLWMKVTPSTSGPRVPNETSIPKPTPKENVKEPGASSTQTAVVASQSAQAASALQKPSMWDTIAASQRGKQMRGESVLEGYLKTMGEIPKNRDNWMPKPLISRER